MKSITITFLLSMMTAVSAIEYVPIKESDISEPAIAITKGKNGQWLEITSREWQDVVYTENGNKSYIYQLGYNYEKQKGFLRTFTPQRKLVNETYNAMTGGMVTREELMKAFEIFKKNKMVVSILEKESAPIYIFGGFGYADKHKDQACYYGQRCVHVFAHTDDNELIAHAIVKLNDDTVPYPDYDRLNQ